MTLSAHTDSSIAGFADTRWSVVLLAAKNDPETSHAALEELCRAYWQPIYSFARKSGWNRADAQDIVQGFFADFLGRNTIMDVNPDRGRFRAFLLACLKHYMANEAKRLRRVKRGGGIVHVPLDWPGAEGRYQTALSETISPDRVFDREWTLTLIERVLDRLRHQCEAECKGEQFENLKEYLMFKGSDIPYEQIAATMGRTAGSVRVIVHRLRKRYRKLLREEVLQTLASPADLEDEIKALIATLAR